MKNNFSKLTYLAGIFLMMGIFSCEGPAGPAGADGTNGVDGVDGVDGLDGNANVTIVTLDAADISWTAGTFLGRATNIYSFTETAVSQDIVDHGTVLGFCYTNSQWWAMPFTWVNEGGTNFQTVFHSYALETISLHAYQTTGVLNPAAITEYRFLLITDNTVTKSAASGEVLLEKLTNAGVDVNDYYSVMDYFGLNY